MSDTPRTTTIINLGVDGEKYRTLERELAAMTKERDELLAENARIIANHGCARHQGTTQFCAEVLAVQKERDELRQHADALAEALDGVELACKRIRSGTDKDHAIWCIETKAASAIAAYRASQQRPGI
jgi:hypothetical protein